MFNFDIIKNQIILADCMNIMVDIPDKFFELAIVDPPYGIKDTWSKNRHDRFHKQGRLYEYQNKEIPPKEYFDQLQRISKNQIIWGGNYYTNFLQATNAWIVWWKHNNPESHMSEAELAWTSFNKVLRVAEFRWNGVIKCEMVEKIHPHQKPVKLYQWVIRNYAKPGDKIIDTHSGSGSLACACHLEKFEFLAIEKDEDYYKSSVKRFEELKSQGVLF